MFRDSTSQLGSDFFDFHVQCAHASLLFADEGHGLELLLPLVGDGDGILLCLLIGHGISLRVGEVDRLLHLFRVLGVPDIVEVALIALKAFWKLVREVAGHVFLLDHLLVQGLDSNLVIGWRIAEFHLFHLQELLLVLEHLLEVILRDHLVGRQIPLSISTYKS